MKGIVIVIIYFTFVNVGAWALFSMKKTDVQFVAQRELTANHLVRRGDLSLYANGRQYVTRKIAAGSKIYAREISDTPKYTTKKNVAPFSIYVDRKQIDSRFISAGTSLLVCPQKVQARVRTVFCGGGPTACIVVIDVPDADVAGLRAAAASALSLRTACGESHAVQLVRLRGV